MEKLHPPTQTRIFFENIKHRFTPDSKNLIYFASGVNLEKIKNFYSNEKFQIFDNIVLVDYAHRVNAIINGDSITYWDIFSSSNVVDVFSEALKYKRDVSKISEVKGNIICFKADATLAVKLFKKHNIKFEYFTAINEGLSQGGARYPMNDNTFQSYALSIVKNEFYHLLWNTYWRRAKKLPFETKEKIQPHNDLYIEVYSANNSVRRSLYRFSDPIDSVYCKQIGSVKVCLIRKSIWQDQDGLNWMGFSLRSKESREGFWPKIKALYRNTTFLKRGNFKMFCDKLTEIDGDPSNKVVGFIPLGMQGRYQEVLDFISNHKFENIKEIRFYHVDQGDFYDIRSQFIQAP